MFDLKQFSLALKQIAEDKGIEEKKIIDTVEAAIAAAYKKDYGEKSQLIRVSFDFETGKLKVWQIKHVIDSVDESENIVGLVLRKEEDGNTVLTPTTSLSKEEKAELKKLLEREEEIRKEEEQAQREEEASSSVKESEHQDTLKQTGGESVSSEQSRKNREQEDGGTIFLIKYNPEKHITLEEAKKTKKKIKIGDEFIISLKPHTNFGRIAAQTAKQVIIQRLREAERESIFEEFKDKEGEVLSGIVQRLEGGTVYIDIGRTIGVLYPPEKNPLDNYRIGTRFRVLVVKIEKTSKGPAILLSRSRPELVTSLFAFEVPEISAGTVIVKGVARETGSRTKIAVTSQQEGVDPIGSLVGQRGIRVQTVINELSGEKIDIIEWKEDPLEFIEKAMSPAKIVNVKMLDKEAKHVLVEVADDQFSLAIGKRGQNVRLAAKLSGYRIDVRTPKQKVVSSNDSEEEVDEVAGDEMPQEEKSSAKESPKKPEKKTSGAEKGKAEDKKKEKKKIKKVPDKKEDAE